MTDPAPDRATGPIFRLMYRSRNRIPQEQRKTELGLLFSQVRPNNKRQQITGALLLSQDAFVQILEGEESAVRALFAKIEKDPRHDSVALLSTGIVAERVFSRWAMAKVADDGESDIPLIANTRGISEAASRGTTPEQNLVLDVMRQAARGEAHAI